MYVCMCVCFVHVCSVSLDFASSTADAQLALPAALLCTKESRRDKIEGFAKTVNGVCNRFLFSPAERRRRTCHALLKASALLKSDHHLNVLAVHLLFELSNLLLDLRVLWRLKKGGRGTVIRKNKREGDRLIRATCQATRTKL